jgi:hypothetical protein
MKLINVNHSTHRWTTLPAGAWFASDSLPKTVQSISISSKRVTARESGVERWGLMQAHLRQLLQNHILKMSYPGTLLSVGTWKPRKSSGTLKL